MKMEFKIVDVDDLVPNPFQPREGFDKESIGELANSLKSVGEIQPIIVKKNKKGYQIIAGERRWRAAKFAKLKEVPVLIKDTTEENVLLESLIENLHRLDLTSVERENAVYELWKTKRWKSYGGLAKQLGKSDEWVEQNVEAASIRKKERIPVEISTRTIVDTAGLEKEDRKQIIAKVQREELHAEKVRDVARILRTEKASPQLRRAVLKPKSRITPRIAETVLELDKEKQPEVIKEIETHRLDEEEAREIVAQHKIELPTPSGEEFLSKVAEIQERYKELQDEIKETLKDPDVQKRGKMFRNWLAHQAMLNVAGSAFCPVCGKGWQNLEWTCDHLNIKEAEKLAAEKYQEKVAKKRGEN